MNVNAFELAEQFAVGRRAEQPPPQRAPGPANENARDIAGACVIGDFLARRRSAERNSLCAQQFRKPQQCDPAIAFGFGQAEQRRGFDIDHDPLGVERRRHALAGAHQPLGVLVRTNRDQQALSGSPDIADRMAFAILPHRGVNAVRSGAQCQFTERDQISFPKKILNRVACLFRHVYFAGSQPIEKLIRRRVHQLHFVSGLEHDVRHCLLHAHAGDRGDNVVQALDVLHVDRRVYVDARIAQFLHVLPALRVARSGLAFDGVGMRQFVHQQQRGFARKRRVQVEITQGGTPIRNLEVGKLLEPLEQHFDFGTTMRLGIAYDDIHALGLLRARLLEHGVGLANTGGGAEEDPKPSALGLRLLTF